MNLHDVDPNRCVRWNDKFRGRLVAEGWIALADGVYLPTVIGGHTVVVADAQSTEDDSDSALRPYDAPSTEDDSDSAPERWRLLMQVALPPRTPGDNYEISDKGDSGDEQPDRSHKHVPEWSKECLSMLEEQDGTDPDTIFGCRVPAVNLGLIFTDDDYRRLQKDRPTRRRRSSGNWSQDRLSRSEVVKYKKETGQLHRISVHSGSVKV